MPGVTVLSPSSVGGFTPGYSTEMQNGSVAPQRETVAEIKELAKENARSIRGVSAASLLRLARSQIHEAQTLEEDGDLKGALSALTKGASLAQMFMESSELRQEQKMPGKKGTLVRDFLEFQQREGRDLWAKTNSLEAKLMELERSASQSLRSGDEVDGPPQKTGGSIADRMRSLQNAGLSVTTTKRLSREVQNFSPPMSPPDTSRPDLSRLHRTSVQNLSSSPVIPSPLLASVAAASSLPSPHSLVPTSSFGPPSPSSSASSSPKLNHLAISDFNTAFPSIDELDEMDNLRLPSMPTGGSMGSSHSGRQSSVDRRMEPSPMIFPKPFPVLPMDPGPRPSSTPIPPTIDTFVSRPGSPVRVPMSPSVPRKPSGLGLNMSISPSRSPVMPAPATPPASEKLELPMTSLFPKNLLELKDKNNFKILLIDVRTREEFEREHIRCDAVICVEPSVLMRDNVTATTIEDSLLVAPRDEWVLFCNRDKFDLVAIYDNDSITMGDARSPLSSLVRAIYETAFRKCLRHIPVLLVGGLEAWKQETNEVELVRGPQEPQDSKSVAALINGVSSPATNGVLAAANHDSRSPLLKSLPYGHSRVPAESSTSTPPPVTFEQDDTLGRNRSGTQTTLESNPHRVWHPSHPSTSMSLDHAPGILRNGVDTEPPSISSTDSKRLVRRPAMTRPTSNSISYPYNPAIPENMAAQHVSPPPTNISPIQYPQFARATISPQISGSSSFASASGLNNLVSMPPQASINPSALSRRRSDYVDQSQEALLGLNSRPSIDYPELSSQHILKPPPAAASSVMERQDNRPRLTQQSQSYSMAQPGPRPPTIQSDYPVTYWPDMQIGTSGLKNLGNTCYMNSTIQCLSATVPFARFFTDGRWKSAVNMVNPLGTKGNLAHAFANILRDMWQGEMQCLNPSTFRRSICQYASQFSGTDQHDSQEFLSFLLDGLHEDLNRVLHKPTYQPGPEREAELERLSTQIASEQEWQIYRMRNDSLVVDFFQGQFRNRLQCLTCRKTSTTYNAFMYLTLPVPTRPSKVTLQQCLELFVKEEVMEKSDAWNCPHCKQLRKATKQLSLSRLPPVLLIHLKRFSVKGHFTDKIETFVDFPLRGLDLTNQMPSLLPPGVSGGPSGSPDDPRSQIPPYKYDLYGVTNHFGTLSSGHYTAFISSRGGWLYCDDSRVSQADAKDVVGKPAYILFYKRVKA